MTWPSHYLVQFRGDFSDGTEHYEDWVTSIRMSRRVAGAPDWSMTQEQLADLAADFSPLIAHGGVTFLCRFLEARAYLIGPDGRAESILYHENSTIVKGTNAAVPMPFHLAWVMTLDTGAKRPPARSGRMFLPGANFTMGADGRVPADTATAQAARMTTFLNAINNLPGIDYSVQAAHASVVSPLPAGSGTIRRVTNVRVGRVLDTLRSRRGKLLEEYSVGAALA